MPQLQREFERFNQELPELLRTMRGQFALVHGDDPAAPYQTEDEAYEAGCTKYGLEPFLVMLVEEQERPLPMQQAITHYADT